LAIPVVTFIVFVAWSAGIANRVLGYNFIKKINRVLGLTRLRLLGKRERNALTTTGLAGESSSASTVARSFLLPAAFTGLEVCLPRVIKNAIE
jgi:hypothetical protein